MRRSRRPLVIASRRSPLARAQAEMVGAALQRLHPAVEIGYAWVESAGDRHKDRSLAEAGGKGLFTGAVEAEVLAGRADLAVHSMKDLPARASEVTAGLAVAAVPMREDVRDCLVSHHGAATLDALPRGAKLGTASPRRAAQVLRLRPDLVIELIRGNIETRLAKVLERKEFDATLLAVAGLNRGGLSRHARHAIDPSILLPAAGQGALALQCRADDHVTLTRCLPLNHAATAAAAHAERAVVAGLDGDCHSAIAALAEVGPLEIRLRVRVLSKDGQRVAEADQTLPLRRAGKLAEGVLKELRGKGAEKLLRG